MFRLTTTAAISCLMATLVLADERAPKTSKDHSLSTTVEASRGGAAGRPTSRDKVELYRDVRLTTASEVDHTLRPLGNVAGTSICGDLDITQSTDPNTVAGGGSVACLSGLNNCTEETDYARSFDLSVGPTAGLAHHVRCVSYGIELVVDTTGAGSPVTINLFLDTSGGAPNVADLVPLAGGSITEMIPDGTNLDLRTVDFTANNVIVPADATLVVAVESPDLCSTAGPNNRHFNGANAAGQSGPSYIRAPTCGSGDYTDLAAIGFPNIHMVLTVGLDPIPNGACCDPTTLTCENLVSQHLCQPPGQFTEGTSCADLPAHCGCEPIIDADGIVSAGHGAPAFQEVFPGAPLLDFPSPGNPPTGLDWFDNDHDGLWSLGVAGDDLHSEDPLTCPTANRDGNHDLGADCKVLDLNNDLVDQQQVDCDLEVAVAFTEPHVSNGGCPSSINNIRYYDANGSGTYDMGEDIVLDANGNNIYDCIECLTDDHCPADPADCVESYCDLGADPKGCADPRTCDFSTECTGNPDCSCLTRPDGSGNCALGVACSTFGSCFGGDADCPAGTKCFVDTCCVDPVCLPNCPTLPPNTDPNDNVCATRPVDGCCANDAECPPDPADCVDSFCNFGDPANLVDNVCDIQPILGCCTSDDQCPPDPSLCYDNFCNFGDPLDLLDNVCDTATVPDCRVSTSRKGSLLAFSKIELKWNAAGALTQDTFLTIVNDYTEDVFVQWYFINGDAPLSAVFNGGLLVERAHRGWNWADCTTELTHNESTYMSMARGTPLGCQPFTILDPGTPPGRPDPEGAPGDRILRGYVIAFAVDQNGEAISWNHLSGSVDIVNYADRSAWEFNGFAAQCVAEPIPGLPCCYLDIVAEGKKRPCAEGELQLNGLQYDFAFGTLLFDFYAVGSQAFTLGLNTVTLDTDLTLYPVDVDLRQDNEGPVTTKAKIDIWNQNEDGFSGSIHCITCWDQTLLSNYAATNNFLIGNIHTDKGKARIDGVASNDCDPAGSCCDLATDPDCFPSANHPFIDSDCSVPAALLGVSKKILEFSGAITGRTDAGMTLVGQGTETAVIRYDLIEPPQPLTTDPQAPDVQNASDVDNASLRPVRASNRGRTATHPVKR